MNRKNIIPLACGIASLALGVAGHGVPAGVFGLCGVIIALAYGRRGDGD
ncbi:hypothetical protein [Bifidobacterium miconisargentati]|nr:hypothetical protein [Bifidobacterium miconisargentati]MBW3090423.1 hypothetical protein [Bifidobacterium miconisargentati]